MNLTSQIKPMSYLLGNAEQIAHDLQHSRAPLVITHNGEASMVVQDIKSYEERENTMTMLKILALGNREYEQGQFRDAEDVFASLDAADYSRTTAASSAA